MENIELNVMIMNLDGVERIIPSSSSSSSSSDRDSHSDSSDSLDSSDNSMSVDSNGESEEESEHDEENALLLMFAAYEKLLFGAPWARVESFLDIVNEKSDEEFRQDFRLHRPVAYDLIESLDASGFIPQVPREKKTAELSFLMFLWYVGNDSVHRDAADLFGCDSTTVLRVVERITEWLLTIMPEHIKWPKRQKIRETSDAFSERAGVRNCIGAIDCSHIFIEKPIRYDRAYWCDEERYSFVLQAVADSNMLFTNVQCGDPGSYRGSRVLQRSELYKLGENGCEDVFPNGTFLLGDKEYVGVGQKWIVTPFKNNGNLTAEQTDFNVRVSSSRVVVEQAFGVLKCRFRYLRGVMSLKDLHFAARLVVACCVLHNVCIRSGDFADDLIQAEEGNDDNGGDNNENLVSDEDAGSEGSIFDYHSVLDDYDDSIDFPDELSRTLAVFRQLYPGATIPANRRANNAHD